MKTMSQWKKKKNINFINKEFNWLISFVIFVAFGVKYRHVYLLVLLPIVFSFPFTYI